MPLNCARGFPGAQMWTIGVRNTSTLLSRLSLRLARLAHPVPTNFASTTPTLSLAGISRWSKTIQFKQRRLLIPVVRLPPGHPLCPLQAYEHQLRCHPAPSSSPAFLKSFDCDIKPITYDAPGTKLRCVLASAGLDASNIPLIPCVAVLLLMRSSVESLSSSSASRETGRLTQFYS